MEEAGLEAVSRTKVVRLVSRHQFLHWLQNHTQLVEKQRGNVTGGRWSDSVGGQSERCSRGARTQAKPSWLAPELEQASNLNGSVVAGGSARVWRLHSLGGS